MSVLQLQNVSKYYYSDTVVTQALRKINLEFQMGEFVAITGESGSGKSTLLNIISGLDVFDEGEMYFKGEPTFQFDGQDWEEYRRNQIGFIFQDYSLIGHYTALDNVVAALVIQERGTEQMESLALGYLEQVGLGEFAGQRASQLSSGQKQRLAIARALAKNTDIIVADEPTGNLDSETGVQVVQLLEKLSREKLVIMVTHNYEQAEPYVTRKIRLHDGEVVTDIPVEHQEDHNAVSQEHNVVNKETAGGRQGLEGHPYGTNQMAGFFALKNIRMQKGRAALFFCFFLITALTSFLFIGELFVYGDDRITKEYDSSAFLQENTTRLVVRYPDNRELTEEDGEKIRSVRHVEEVDLYDYANDVRYYFQEGKGYQFVYGKQEKKFVVSHNEQGELVKEEQYQETKGIDFLITDQYVRSASCLSENDLSAGRLPESRNEVVLYTKDENILNQEQECYFTADNIWQPEETFHIRVTVVGILKEKTDQIYFDCSLCQMLTVGLELGFNLDYCWDEDFKKYRANMEFFPVIADDLVGNEIRISGNYTVPSTGYQGVPTDLEEAFGSSALLHAYEIDDGGDTEEISDSLRDMDDETQSIAIMGVMVETEGIVVQIRQGEFSDQGPDIIEVSQELFDKLYQAHTTQASVYISSYGKTDAVINKLIDLGYDALSTYRVSSTTYNQSKVYQRLEVIGISVLVLIVLLILQVLLVRSVLKLKIRDYAVLKFMGMRVRQMNRITYLEMGVHCVMAILVTLVVMAALCVGKMPFIVHMMQYYSLWGMLLFVAYNFLLLFLTVFFFNRLCRVRGLYGNA